MDAFDEVNQLDALWTHAIDNALEQLSVPGKESLKAAFRPSVIARRYRVALLAAAAHAPREVAEHYTALAAQVVGQSQFLSRSLAYYRIRKNIE